MPESVNLVFLVTLCTISAVYSLPHVTCPDLFEYVQEGDRYFGRITLSNLPLSTVTVDVSLVNELPEIYIPTYGRLSTEPDLASVNRQLNRGEPIKYRVDFSWPDKPPKLLGISVNGNEICDASGIPPPSHTLYLQHTIYPVRETLSYESPKTPPDVYHQRSNNKDNPFLNRVMPPFNRLPTVAPVLVDQGKQPTQVAYLDRTTAVPLLPKQGRQPGHPADLASGDTQTARGQFPWLSAIFSRFSQTFRFICGGSLISRRTVVSAAHCLVRLSPENVVTYLGRHNLTNYSEDGYISRAIENIILHPEFNMNVLNAPDADIAILQLDTPVDYTQYITPILLWSGPDELERIAVNLGSIVGWGSQERDSAVSSVPIKVDVNILSEEECLRASTLFTMVGTARTFCAGIENNIGSCLGDAGTGLMIQRNGVWMLRGIASAGAIKQRKCDPKELIIYCDVAKHTLWIKENMV